MNDVNCWAGLLWGIHIKSTSSQSFLLYPFRFENSHENILSRFLESSFQEIHFDRTFHRIRFGVNSHCMHFRNSPFPVGIRNCACISKPYNGDTNMNSPFAMWFCQVRQQTIIIEIVKAFLMGYGWNCFYISKVTHILRFSGFGFMFLGDLVVINHTKVSISINRLNWEIKCVKLSRPTFKINVYIEII